MNTILNTPINKDFKLNQDIKKLTKQIHNFLNTYAYKSSFIQSEIKDLKHNDYLNIVSKFFGYTDYNQYNKEDNKKVLSLENLLAAFEKFLYSLPNKSGYDNGDINQIVNTFHLYLTLTEQELYKEKRSVTNKIQRRIKNLIKDDKTLYKGTEIERLYNIVSNTYFQPIITDYRSIIIYKENSPTIMDFRGDQNDELVNLFLKYYDVRNALIIKRYVKDERFDDNIGEHLYLLDDFLKERFHIPYKPFEYIEFLAVQYKHYHHGINDDIYRKSVNEFKAYIAEKTIGRNVLVKGIFNTISKDRIIHRDRAITYNADGEWSIFEITLANSDTLELIVTKNGTFAIQKDFGDKISCHILLSYDLKEPDKLVWTIPMVERHSVIKERFRFFYPKKADDKFMLKLSFNEGYDLITLTRDGIFEDGEVKFSFKNMMQILYEDGIQKLQNINVPVEKYIEIYERDYKE